MENHLNHLEAFKTVLASYQISDESKQVLAQTKLVLLVAPSSSGRNTLIRKLTQTDQYHYIVSDTTRHKRSNDGVMEQNGAEYWFRTEQDMLNDLKNGDYLEAAIIHNQQVSGISIRELKKARDEGKAALSDIEIVGMQNIIAAKPDAYPLFILPPSFDEWMKRMDGRGEMSVEEKRRRLGSAVQEFTAAIDHDYYQFVINDKFDHAVQKIHEVVYEDKRSQDHDSGRELAKQLREATQTWLYEN